MTYITFAPAAARSVVSSDIFFIQYITDTAYRRGAVPDPPVLLSRPLSVRGRPVREDTPVICETLGNEEFVCRLKALKRGSTEIERRLLHVCVEVEGLLGVTDSAG
jgi:hypothetical protein